MRYYSHIHQHTFYYTNALFFGRMRCVSPVVSMFQCLCQVLQMYNVHVGLVSAPLLSLVFDSPQERCLQVPPKLVSPYVKFECSPNQQSTLYNMAMGTVVLIESICKEGTEALLYIFVKSISHGQAQSQQCHSRFWY